MCAFLLMPLNQVTRRDIQNASASAHELIGRPYHTVEKQALNLDCIHTNWFSSFKTTTKKQQLKKVVKSYFYSRFESCSPELSPSSFSAL